MKTSHGMQPGVDRPDNRGRTGLDQVGRDLTGNPDVIVRDVEVTSDGWHVTIGDLEHVYDVYMSPGSVTERLHFYAAPYTPAVRTTTGGGVTEEGEDIEILELAYDDALRMISEGVIADGKTIMLLYWAAIDGPFAEAARNA